MVSGCDTLVLRFKKLDLDARALQSIFSIINMILLEVATPTESTTHFYQTHTICDRNEAVARV